MSWHHTSQQRNRIIVICCAMSISYSLPLSATENTLCTEYKGLPEDSGTTASMVWIKSGTFIMGNNKGHTHKATRRFEPYYEEKNEHKVSVDGFWIDQHEVTNAQFLKFVEDTGYITVVERKPKKEWYPPGFPEKDMIAGSAVFKQPKSVENQFDITQWWQFVKAANWRQPQGSGSNIQNKMNHPVVQVTHEDASAYAKWAGKSLATEAQWEYAARAGLISNPYSWGENYKPNGKWMANTWQGQFPVTNKGEDGYFDTAPVGCFPENAYGLYDMAGNVWEIVNDSYSARHKEDESQNQKATPTVYELPPIKRSI